MSHDAPRPLTVLLVLLAVLAAACDDDDGDGNDAGPSDTAAETTEPDAPEPDTADTTDVADTSDTSDAADQGEDADVAPPAPDFLNTLASADDFVRLADAEDTVKYLFNVEGATPREPLTAPCTFQNTLRFPYHIQFLRSLPELAELTFDEYGALVLRAETRIWWGGSLQDFPRTPHPIAGAGGTVIYTIYTDPSTQAVPTLENILEVDARAKACAPYAADRLAFVPADPWQQEATRQMAQALSDAGVAYLFPEQLVP